MKAKTPKSRNKKPRPSNKPLYPETVGHQRINRILSLAGLTSRRNADAWLKSGLVWVNGKRVTELGARAVWGGDSIQVDGKEIPPPYPRVYIMVNKPFGYISGLKDPENRPLVVDLLQGLPERVYPVGRLDFDSMGLLIMTNDGELAFRLTHPRYHVPRTYKVTVEGAVTETALKHLAQGVRLEDGFSGRAKITLISRNQKQSVIRMTLTQGRSRQVRRMLDAVGFKVVHLMRTGFGGLRLLDLKVGAYRPLTSREVEDLQKMVGLGRS